MRVRDAALSLLAVALMAGCSGGGSTSSPAPKPTLGGAGAPAAFDQKITFTIEVPGTTNTSASARNRKTQAAAAPTATPQATTPYVSARTGSVVLTLAEVNGISPQQAAPIIPAVNVPATCQGSTTGCTIPVANVPAALGTDRYYVQTFAGANGTGNLISTGFVDVAVPVKANANPAIGGTAALSIGGYVARVVLAPASLGVVSGTASDLNVLVQGFDPAGAAIVGAAQYATPITVSVDDTSNFAFAGAPSTSVSGPLAAPLVLHYGGGTSFGTNVQAVTRDQNAVAVNASPIPIDVFPPGTPIVGGVPEPTPAPSVIPTVAPTAIPTRQPTPVPTAKPPPTPPPVAAMSLYVADGDADTISEYRIASQIASGTIPDPRATPSRVVRFDPTLVKSPLIAAGALGCSPAQSSPTGSGNGTAGVAVDPASGTIFVLPSCTDGTQTYVFGYSPAAVGTPAPTIYDPFPGGFGAPNGLVAANALVYASTSTPQGIYGFPMTRNGLPPTVATGGNCFNQFGTAVPPICFGVGFAQGFAVDNNRFAYIPGQWQPDANGNSLATGDASALFDPAAILVVPASGANPNVTPYAAIAGLNASVGNIPLAATSDGTTLYVLTGQGTITSADANTTYFPGLSACPPPSANAPVNPVVTSDFTTACAGGQQHVYLAAYAIGTQLLGPAANGTDVDLIPNFLLGGDTVGGFGCPPSISGGQFIAANRGFVYVINQTPTCDANGVNLAPEVDVYNTNGITGAHTDIAPILRLTLPTGYPLAVAVGPSGTVSGGQSLLQSLGRTYRPQLYASRHARQRRARPYSSIRHTR